MAVKDVIKDDQYRHAALRLYGRLDDVKVSHWANVQRVEHGAFVEVLVWVPDGEAERSTA